MNEFVRSNLTWVLGVLGMLVLGAFEARLQYVVSERVTDKINEVGGVTPSQLELAKKDVTSNKNAIAELRNVHRSDADRIDSKVERIVDILLEE